MTLSRTVLEAAPSGLTAAVISPTQINLSWNVNARATSYRVYRNGSLIGSPTGNSFNATGLTASTSYTFVVSSVGASGEGPGSAGVSATTSAAADTIAPTAPGTPVVTPLSTSSLFVQWAASTDNVGIASYQIERRTTVSAFAVIATQASTSLTDAGLDSGTVYEYRIRAVDTAGNVSVYSLVGAGQTLAPGVGAGDPWSVTGTWSGPIPIAGQSVTIPAGRTIALDLSTPSLGPVTVNGTLRLDGAASTALTCESLTLGPSGAILCGSAAAPFEGSCVVTLTGTNRHISITSASQRLELFALSPLPHVTILNATVSAGATVLQTANNPQRVTPPNTAFPGDVVGLTRWRSGDDVAVGPSDWYTVGRSEVRSLAGDAIGGVLNLSSGLSRGRWGQKQYINESAPTGVSLTRQDFFAALTTPVDVPETPHDVPIDERAPIVNLTRRIVLQGANDAQWGAGNGLCITVTNRNATVRLDGVGIRRCGQRGVLHRYPLHWSMLSYVAGTSTVLGDVPTGQQYVRRSVIRDSENRGIVVRGTCGVEVSDTVIFATKGHGLMLPEGSEMRNRFLRVVCGDQDSPALADRLTSTERPYPTSGAGLVISEEACVSGIAAASLANDFIDCRQFGSQGHGFWFGVPDNAIGDSAATGIRPRFLPEGTLLRNVSHSNAGIQGLARGSPTNTTGTIEQQFIEPKVGGVSGGADLRADFEEFYFFKGRIYGNRVKFARYHRWTVSSVIGLALFGATLDAEGPDGVYGTPLDRNFLIGRTLNNANDPVYDEGTINQTYVGGASYHFSAIQFQNFIVNFPFIPNRRYSGGVSGDDLYIRSVEKGWYFGSGNRYIAAYVGTRSAPPFLGGIAANPSNLQYALAGAIWDLWGYYNGNKNSWSVYNIPLFTEGGGIVGSAYSANSLTVDAVNVTGGEDEFAGIVQPFLIGRDPYDSPFQPRVPMLVRRMQTDYVTALGGPAWQIEDGTSGNALFMMRHVSLRKNGRYILTFPGISPQPTAVELSFENFYHGAGQSFMLGVQFSGAVDPSQTFFTTQYGGRTRAANNPARRRDFSAAGSLAAVATGTGNLYWRDTVNNLVWFRLVADVTSSPAYSTDIYRTASLIITA